MSRRRYPGYIEKHRDRLRVVLRIGGRRYRYTLETANRKEAETFARNKYAELEQQHQRRGAGFPGPLPCSELLTQFEKEEMPTKSPGCRRSYRCSVKPIRQYFVTELGDPAVDQVRAGTVEGFLTWRRAHRIKTRREGKERIVEALAGVTRERTVAKDRAVLHAIFAMAERREYRDGNPVARTRAPKYDARQPVILTDAEYAKLLDQCGDPMLRLYVLVLGETGARDESEALWLRWEDIDLEGGFLRIASGRNGHRTKSGKDRWTPMTPALATAMREHFAAFRLASPSPWLFHHTRTRRHHKADDRIRSLRAAVRAAADRAKLPAAWHLHDLRHRRVTTWLAQGKNPVHVKEAVGHSDLRTTMGYTHLAREHLRALVDTPAAKPPLRATESA
ncbi:MAG TPA: tyrosine-type recombinase/integrase [Gemmatimonadales bacterium]|nr:tyrosine-type recombinase/integrase [Gemmatimonadales bacterium]